jgi:hypothetical protein
MVLFKQLKMMDEHIFEPSLVSQISKDGLSSSSPTTRRVKLAIGNEHDDGNSGGGEGLNVHHLEPLSEEEIRSYYMQRQDFKRCDADTKETILEWAKYQMGHRKECPNIRGLEDLLDQLKFRMAKKTENNNRLVKKSQHVRKVLQEVSRQKSTRVGGVTTTRLDSEQIRRVSLELSKDARIRAKKVALADEKEAREILGDGSCLKAPFDSAKNLRSSPTESVKASLMASEQ